MESEEISQKYRREKNYADRNRSFSVLPFYDEAEKNTNENVRTYAGVDVTTCIGRDEE